MYVYTKYRGYVFFLNIFSLSKLPFGGAFIIFLYFFLLPFKIQFLVIFLKLADYYME